MLLRELKQIFETDRQPLESGLAGLNIQTDRVGDHQGGDVDDELKWLVEKFIVTMSPPTPTRDDLKGLTSTISLYNRAVKSMTNLTGTLGRIEGQFTGMVSSYPGLVSIAQGERKSVDAFIAQIVANLKLPTSSLRQRHFTAAEKLVDSKRDVLVRNVMKIGNAETFWKQSAIQLRNILEKTKDSAGNPIPKEVVETEAKEHLEQFYMVMITLQKNTEILMDKIKANKPPTTS